MNQYITGSMIKALREKQGLTQNQLSEKLCVSDKTISKWETGKGYPDIVFLEPLAKVLGISMTELFMGEQITNANVSANMQKVKFYVCPVCGNVIYSTGQAVINCHGLLLQPQEAEPCDDCHAVLIEKSEDEYFVQIEHEMTKSHYISFIAGIYSDKVEFVKQYPEMNAQCRIKIAGLKQILFYCNRDGLFKKEIQIIY